MSLAEMDKFWNEAKQFELNNPENNQKK